MAPSEAVRSILRTPFPWTVRVLTLAGAPELLDTLAAVVTSSADVATTHPVQLAVSFQSPPLKVREAPQALLKAKSAKSETKYFLGLDINLIIIDFKIITY